MAFLACVLERSVVDTLTLAVVSLLLHGDGRGQMFIEMKTCCGLFTAFFRHFSQIVAFTFTFWRESKLLYLIRLHCECATIRGVRPTALPVFFGIL